MNSPSSTVQNIVNNQNDSLQSNGNGQIKNVIVVNNNAPSTNISTEETTVTPDVPLSTSDIVSSLLNQGEDIDIYVDNEPTGSLLVESETERLLVEPETGPSRILLDTGIHLTTKEDNTPKNKPILRHKKTPKKAADSESDTSFKKPRLKRACVIDKAERKKSGLYKLGKHIEGRDGRWKITLTNTSLPMFQCPICDTFLTSPESRITHELEMHSSLLKSINKSVDMVSNPGNTADMVSNPGNTADMVSNPGNTACTQQLSIINYLKLYETSKYKTSVVQELIKRTKLLRAFNTLGDDIIGSFKCKYCPYETKLVFVLWAHKQTTHLYLKCEYEKKMRCNYCFLCNRTLPKRTIQLKHFNACIKKQMELPIPIVKRPTKILKCVPCDVRFNSLVELEDHLWGHAKK